MTSSRSVSTYTLIGANAVPLFGVLFLSWSLVEILFLFWAETAVVGIFAFWKIVLSQKVDEREMEVYKKMPVMPAHPGRLTKRFLLFFFPFHFGMFMLGHAFFLTFFFLDNGQTIGSIFVMSMWYSLATLFGSHMVSFFMNYVEKKEYLHITPQHAMIQPYKRVMLMHVTIVLGSIVVSIMGAPIVALVFLVCMKIALDLFAHKKEHPVVQSLGAV